MNTAAMVDQMIDQWKQQGLSKSDIVVNTANACIGWPYVFGAWGEECTPANRKARYKPKYPTIYSKCQQLREDNRKNTCNGCRWYPGGTTRIYDCRGFTRWLMGRVGITINGSGATSQYNDNSNWEEKGPIANMPKDKVCCVFRYDSSTGKMEHTLLYDGQGNYIHCSGEVKKTPVSKYNATHYAIPKGLNGGDPPVPTPTPTPEKGTAIVTGTRVALRQGPSTSANVITRVDTGSTVKLLDPPEDWKYVSYNGKTGYMMAKFLNCGT